MNTQEIRGAALIIHSLNHKMRQQIIQLLEEHSHMTVTELYVKLCTQQSIASQHLMILRRAGVVTVERNGKFMRYSLHRSRLETIGNVIKELNK